MKSLRAGVVGAGVFGGYHANKYASLPGVTLVGVLDADGERAGALAGKLGARPFTDAEAFFAELDVVTIASPATVHAELATQALGRDVHAYIEKPLALSVADGQALIDLAAAKGLVLSCGHQERAVFGAMGLMDAPEAPSRLQAVRRSPFTGRATDVSCILDIMIHDLDLALALTPSDPVEVRATGRIQYGPHLDEVSTQITFADGMVVDLNACRTDEGRTRTMGVDYPSGPVRIDFMTRAFENGAGFALNADFAETPASPASSPPCAARRPVPWSRAARRCGRWLWRSGWKKQP
jgi:predicted dehydrogenase